jgi:uncharacterized protein (TIGR01777 family)
MRVLVTGSSGLVGSALRPALDGAGHRVVRLVRRAATHADEASWDPDRGAVDAAALEGFDAVVHLAGESVASGRWTAARKARIRSSRVDATALLCNALARCARPPAVFVGASAVGYYGVDRGGELLTESSGPGADFLATLCLDWERAAQPLAPHSRVVHLRIGMVLAREGGALTRIALPFRLGLGGRLGPGTQYVSWIAIEDMVAAVLHALGDGSVTGPCNATAPNPVTNLELTKALGRALHRPTVLPVPSLALRLLLGELADCLLLASQRAVPRALQARGFAFRHPTIDTALEACLCR